MTYFRVPDKLADKPIRENSRSVRYLIAGELYTEREADKLSRGLKYVLEQVEYKKSDTYWFFGARFAD